mmetsp:Transcript_22715/g.70239  ORF Transcript_22715/g.70239 Transcript_22715/m.70239 type:complete len:200 (+) Transcript_22715:1680-2279(+)
MDVVHASIFADELRTLQVQVIGLNHDPLRLVAGDAEDIEVGVTDVTLHRVVPADREVRHLGHLRHQEALPGAVDGVVPAIDHREDRSRPDADFLGARMYVDGRAKADESSGDIPRHEAGPEYHLYVEDSGVRADGDTRRDLPVDQVMVARYQLPPIRQLHERLVGKRRSRVAAEPGGRFELLLSRVGALYAGLLQVFAR